MTPRFIQLHPRTHNKLSHMLKEAAAEGAYRVANRIRAVLLNHDNSTSGEIAKTLKASRSGVSEWLKIYAEQGVDGLLEGRRSGRPGFLSDVDKILLCDIIDSGPIAYGYVSGLWTSIRIVGEFDTVRADPSRDPEPVDRAYDAPVGARAKTDKRGFPAS